MKMGWDIDPKNPLFWIAIAPYLLLLTVLLALAFGAGWLLAHYLTHH